MHDIRHYLARLLGRRFAARLAFAGGLALLALPVLAWLLNDLFLRREPVRMEFHGPIVGTDFRSERGRDNEVDLLIRIRDGREVRWPVPLASKDYYQSGDFLVKLPGRKLPAVFREGRQLGVSGAPYYLKERLNLADYQMPRP